MLNTAKKIDRPDDLISDSHVYPFREVQLFPNPSTFGQELYLNSLDGETILQWTISDVHGMTHDSIDLISSEGTGSRLKPDLPAGLYFIRIETN